MPDNQPPTDADASLIDMSMGLSATDHNAVLLRKLLITAQELGPRYTKELREAAANGNILRVKLQVHKIRGMLAYFCTRRVIKALDNFESECLLLSASEYPPRLTSIINLINECFRQLSLARNEVRFPG